MTTLQIGDQIPAFSSTDQNGKTITSASMLGKKWVLYFYPKDNTPTCTIQACNLRDHFPILEKKQITVIGVSMDAEKSHQKFASRFNLPFTLLADTDRSVIEAFGVWGPKKFMGRTFDGIHRTTFVINEQNTIIGIISKPKSRQHSQEILQIFESVSKDVNTLRSTGDIFVS